MTDKKLVAIVGGAAAFVLAVFVIIGLVAGYYFLNEKYPATAQTPAVRTQAQVSASPKASEIPFFSQVLSEANPPDGATAVNIIRIIFHLLLALIFSALLAFRPRPNIPMFQRNISVAQTEILLAVVAAALMMIVGDNTARAFAIFAAVSFVRFRTNIRDPKEITVLVISLALGLAAGVGRWDLGVVLCLFALGLLWFLESKEPEQVMRSMELTVKTPDLIKTQEILRNIFAANQIEAEIRQIEPPGKKDTAGSLMYYLNLPLKLSTDVLSEQIAAAGSGNIEGIVWKNQKNTTYVYQ
jgi:uncharacterized membrane protein YhiD involved in acid resistance